MNDQLDKEPLEKNNQEITENKKKYNPKLNHEEKNKCLRFVQKYPILTVLALSFIMIIIILAIVLPLTLVKKREERPVVPACPDGKTQPRIDCLPDKNNLIKEGSNLEAVCRKRSCCWSTGPEGGGPSCTFHYNYGFRALYTKENYFASERFKLVRTNSPPSFARSDIANLEAKIEMHTDQRLRIKIFPRRNFKNKMQRWEIPTGIKSENLFKPDYRVEYSLFPFSIKVIRNNTGQVMYN